MNVSHKVYYVVQKGMPSLAGVYAWQDGGYLTGTGLLPERYDTEEAAMKAARELLPHIVQRARLRVLRRTVSEDVCGPAHVTADN